MGGRRGAPGGARLGTVIWPPTPVCPLSSGPSRAWVASRFVFIFNSLYCSNHLRATENKTVILSRPQFPGLNCLPFANFSF